MKRTFLGVILLCVSFIVSCEKDFEEIGTSIVSNNSFTTKDTIIEISISQNNVDKVIADNISTKNYIDWLGVYKKNGYKTIKSSIVASLNYNKNLIISDKYKNNADTIVEPIIDAVFLKLPYFAVEDGKNSNGSKKFTLDSILGNKNANTKLSVYQNNTFLNRLDPTNPSKLNKYWSNKIYSKGTLLSEDPNFSFKLNPADTIVIFNRFSTTTDKDTLKLASKKPFLVVPLDKSKIENILLSKYNQVETSSEDKFLDYFRGLYIEATGNDGALMPLNFSSKDAPSLEIYYTNKIKKGGAVVKTEKRTTSFTFGIVNNIYDVVGVNVNSSNNVTLQGTAGSDVKIDILSDSQLNNLRAKNWLINDAKIEFFIDASKDTINPPTALSLFKRNATNNSFIKDIVSEASFYGGVLSLKDSKPYKYTFRIRNHIADLLAGRTNYNPSLGLKVFNPTDRGIAANDTIVRDYNWNPKSIALFNNSINNSDKRAFLKISYSVKNN